jgi:hypothetical protein
MEIWPLSKDGPEALVEYFIGPLRLKEPRACQSEPEIAKWGRVKHTSIEDDDRRHDQA